MRQAIGFPRSQLCVHSSWGRTGLPPEAQQHFVQCLALLRGKVTKTVQSTLFLSCRSHPPQVTLIETAAVVTHAPLMEVGRLPEGGLADGCLELQGCLRWICAGFSPQLSWLELLSYHTKTLSLQCKAVARGWPWALISAPLGRKPVYCVHENPALACDKCTCATRKEGAAFSGGRIDSGLIPSLAAQ